MKWYLKICFVAHLHSCHCYTVVSVLLFKSVSLSLTLYLLTLFWCLSISLFPSVSPPLSLKTPPHYLSFWQMSHKVFVSLHLSISISLVLSATESFNAAFVCVMQRDSERESESERATDRRLGNKRFLAGAGVWPPAPPTSCVSLATTLGGSVIGWVWPEKAGGDWLMRRVEGKKECTRNQIAIWMSPFINQSHKR